jgi:hypothetical protein
LPGLLNLHCPQGLQILLIPNRSSLYGSSARAIDRENKIYLDNFRHTVDKFPFRKAVQEIKVNVDPFRLMKCTYKILPSGTSIAVLPRLTSPP